MSEQTTTQPMRKEVLSRNERVYVPFTAANTPEWLRPIETLGGNETAWIAPGSLPPVVVGEHRLNEHQVRGLLGVLRSFPDARPKVRQYADPSSLDAFAWRLFELWLAKGAPANEKWAMQAMGALGGDACAMKLAPLIRAWPGESQHQRAVAGLECLRAIGSDTALMQLNGIAQKIKYKALQNRAREFMAAVAKARGLTAAELEDRIVPNLDLDEQGGRIFDFGSQQFRLCLDANLTPMVRDEAGQIRGDLPKPGAKDDPEKAAAAVADWRLLKKQLRELVKIQVVRLEQAMIVGRRWPAKDFVNLIARHPVMTNLARLLLWGRFTEQEKRTGLFRVNEEMELVDAENSPVQPAEQERIGLVHPLHLDAAEKGRWSEVFAEYELLPPFPQLARVVRALEPGELQANLITRHGDVPIPSASLIGTLERLGWKHGQPMDGGCYDNFSKQFPWVNVTAAIAFEPGIPISYREVEDQKVRCCLFLGGLQAPTGYVRIKEGELEWSKKPLLRLDKVDPLVMSEVLGDLAVLASKGKE